jgi:hypothetical protein
MAQAPQAFTSRELPLAQSEDERRYYALNAKVWSKFAPFYDAVVFPVKRLRREVASIERADPKRGGYTAGARLALGLLVLVLFTAIIVWRLLDEEVLLSKDLPGYDAYRQKVSIPAGSRPLVAPRRFLQVLRVMALPFAPRAV